MDDFFEEQFDNDVSLAVAKKPGKKKSKEEEGQLTVDVYQTDDEIIIKSTVAGVTPDDMDISITNDMVTVKGRRDPAERVKQSDYYYQELYWGPFSRSIILPEEIDSDNAKAIMKNGVLTLRLPKLAKSKVKKIKVSS
ncbi:MAG: Hsp20/alpha crystallin family protein [Candidatus Paceibacterota bacterium]